MKRGIKELFFRSVILLIGLVIAHLGVTLFLISDLGSDPFNVLVKGTYFRLSSLWEYFGFAEGILTHGRVHIAISLIIIVVLLIVDRSYIKIGTVLCMVCGGPIIDFFTWILNPVLSNFTGLAPRIIILAIGCVILAYGMTIVIKSDAGTGPNDLVAVVISDKLKKKFSITRIIVDLMFALAGCLLGWGVGFELGVHVGIGTLIAMALVGPVAGIFLPINEKMIDKVLGAIMKK